MSGTRASKGWGIKVIIDKLLEKTLQHGERKKRDRRKERRGSRRSNSKHLLNTFCEQGAMRNTNM